MARLPDVYNGSAAYDLYHLNNGSAVRVRDYGTAAPEIQRPAGLPEEKTLPQKKRRVKVKAAVAPFGVVGLGVVVCLMVLVVFGYVQMYEATERVSSMESRIASLEEEQRILTSLYEGAIDLITSSSVPPNWAWHSRRKARRSMSICPVQTMRRSTAVRKAAGLQESSGP